MMIDEQTFFSFGGGVQSTAVILLMLNKPELFQEMPMPRHIIFADTGAETQETYDHIEQIEKLVKPSPHIFHTVRNEKLGKIHESSKGLSYVCWFTSSSNGVGMLRRQCTSHFKIQPIENKIRELLNLKPRQRTKNPATLWLGISIDEVKRAKPSTTSWYQKRFPLIDLGINRTACAVFNQYILNKSVPKSSCFFCPYIHRQEWMRIKEKDSIRFNKAVTLDKKIRKLKTFGAQQADLYIHSSGLPLEQAVISQLSIPGLDLGFSGECDGHCGL